MPVTPRYICGERPGSSIQRQTQTATEALEIARTLLRQGWRLELYDWKDDGGLSMEDRSLSLNELEQSADAEGQGT